MLLLTQQRKGPGSKHNGGLRTEHFRVEVQMPNSPSTSMTWPPSGGQLDAEGPEKADRRVHLNVREEAGQHGHRCWQGGAAQAPRGQGPLSVFGKASPHVRFMPTALLWFRWDLATMCKKCHDVCEFHLFGPMFSQLHISPVCCTLGWGRAVACFPSVE